MKHYHSGYDYFTPDPGEWDSCNCQACGSAMDVERDTKTRTSRFDPSYTKQSDLFTCPHAGEEWHDQVIALKKCQHDTPSKTITDLLEVEIQQIIQSKTPTKTNYLGF